jgi:hypothetical protein
MSLIRGRISIVTRLATSPATNEIVCAGPPVTAGTRNVPDAAPFASVVVEAKWKMLPVLRCHRICTGALTGKWVSEKWTSPLTVVRVGEMVAV